MRSRLFIAGLLSCLAIQSSFAAEGLQSAETKNVISDYAKTKYPLVFVHGMFGFNRLGSAEFGLDYWYQVLPDLAKNGATAYATQVSPLESTEVRGEQLLQQVEEVVALTGKNKVNLIGHSHGGPTARYIAGVRPDLVSSVTSVAGTNFGSPVADLVQNVPLLNTALAAAVDALVSPIISYALDPDTLLTSMCYVAFGGQKNDGLVSQCSSRLGKTIRDDYYHNHFDEVNQVLGLRSVFSADPVSLYRQHANRLKLQGL